MIPESQQNGEKRRVLITGGTGSLGEKLIEVFLNSGDEVLFTYNNSKDKAQQLLDSYQNSSLHSYQLNSRDQHSVDQLTSYIGERWGDFDILINNAGLHNDKILALMTDEQWESTLDTNVTGVFRLIRAAIPMMLGGENRRIINISSVAASIALRGQSNYAASKAALESMSRVLSKEVSKYDITVNCVAPGFLDEGMTDSIDKNLVRDYLDMIPLKRFGQAKEVANVVYFLASTQASYITGTTIPVSGGL